jgi:hypothetical protein
VPFELEVLPADVLVRVESSGGLTGALEVLTLLGRGELRARAEDGAESSGYASAEAISNARQLLARLPRASRSHRDRTTSELVMHRLTYWLEDALVVAELDETTLQAEERSLLALLAGLRR